MTTPPAAAPWVRTRLRATPLAALLTAGLVLATVLLAAALPRALDRSADGALRDLVRRNGPIAGAVTATTTARADTAAGTDGTTSALPAQQLSDLADTLTRELRPPLRLGPGGTVYGAYSRDQRSLTNPELARPDGVAPGLRLAYLHDTAGHARLTTGRWPTNTAHGAGTERIEVALAESVASKLGTGVGAVLDAGQGTGDFDGLEFQAVVVGLFAPQDPGGPFWAGSDCLTAPCLDSIPTGPGEISYYWRASALIGPDQVDGLRGWGHSGENFVRLPIDPAPLRADRLPETRAALASLLGGTQASTLPTTTGRSDLRFTSPLLAMLDQAELRQRAIAPLTVLGPVGAAGVALTVLLQAAALAGERRAGELRLLRARGASRGGVLRRLLGESAATTLPAALAGTALALLLLPTPRWGGAVVAAAVVTLVALFAFPLRAAYFPDAEFGSGRRRLVAELLVLAAAAGAAVTVRQRGIAPAGAGIDLLLVAAPLLIALAGAVLLARVQPLVVGLAAARARRRSGAIGFLGLTRAAHGGGARRPSLLPLLALLLAVTTAGFGATVLSAVDDGRLRAARIETGGDARVGAVEDLPDGFADAAGQLPGVTAGVGALVDRTSAVGTADRGLMPGLTVLVVDPDRYAALARWSGQGTFDPALLAGGTDEWVPALVTGGVAARLDDQTHAVHLGDRQVPIRQVGVIDGAPGLGTGEAIVLPARQTVAKVPALKRTNLWFGEGNIRPEALRGLLARLDPRPTGDGPDRYVVRTSAEVVQRLAADPLQHSAARTFRGAVLAAGGFAVLAVLLSLVRSGPERAALLARLRTMGLRPRQGLALILTEAMPQALVAAAAGALLAVTALLLLGPAVDLSALVGASVHTGVEPAAWPVLEQALALAAVFAATVLAEAVVSGRRQITTELRAGDDR